MSEEQRSGILAGRKRWSDHMAAKEDDKILELYTEDCRIMPGGKDVVIGKQGMADEIVKFREAGVVKVISPTDEIGTIDEITAYCVGRFTTYGEDGSEISKGVDLNIWKKIDGVYYLYTDIWNMA
ncbi:uncharacterized protein LOC144437893 [Glandiceps talaboti]